MVFDGVMPHIAGARRGEFNHRFAQPSAATMQGPGTVFPFTDNEQVDPVTGQRDGLLRRLTHTGHCPKIVYTNTSAEYWRGDASLSHISVDGTTDVALPETVRLYLFAGTQHGPGRLPLTNYGRGGAWPVSSEQRRLYPAAAGCPGAPRPLGESVTNHRRRAAIPAWLRARQYRPRAWLRSSRHLPGKAFPAIMPQPQRLDFGPAWEHGVASWLPPRLGEPLPDIRPGCRRGWE